MAQEKSVKYPHLFSLPSFPVTLVFVLCCSFVFYLGVGREVGADTPFAG